MFEKQPWMQRAGEFPQSDREYFALLSRAVFSAGLGPKVVESRWKEMAQAFHDFDPSLVTRMDEQDVARLLSDPGVIRNRRKIEAVIKNAATFLEQTGAVSAHLGEEQVVDVDGGASAKRTVRKPAAAGRGRVDGGRAGKPTTDGYSQFHHYLLDLGAAADLDGAADGLAQVFTHLGRTSALFFLFSAGWRPNEAAELLESEGLAALANG